MYNAVIFFYNVEQKKLNRKNSHWNGTRNWKTLKNL